MRNIIIFGPPGSGKGTQGVKIAEKYKLTHISTGEVIRQEIDAATDLGKYAEKLIGDGQLIPECLQDYRN